MYHKFVISPHINNPHININSKFQDLCITKVRNNYNPTVRNNCSTKASLRIQLAQLDKAKWDLITVFNIIICLFI